MKIKIIKNLVAVLLLFTSVIYSQYDPAWEENFVTGPDNCHVMDYGATGDGVALDQAAIQAAIDACAVNGGTVRVPEGQYLTGTLVMQSGVTLYLEKNAVLLGSGNLEHFTEYPEPVPLYNEGYSGRSIIYANNLTNIAIRGAGEINGQGELYTNDDGELARLPFSNRPRNIHIFNSTNVIVENIFLTYSAFWMQYYVNNTNLVLRGLRVYNHGHYNNDALDMEGCQNCLLEELDIDSDDDGLCFKGLGASTTDNLLLRNSRSRTHASAIKFGTESQGVFKNFTVKNIRMEKSTGPASIWGIDGLAGIALEVVDGATMENVQISDVDIEGYTSTLFLRLGNRGRHYDGLAQVVGTLRNVDMKNIRGNNSVSHLGNAISGIPDHMIQNVSFENIRINNPGGGTEADASRVIQEKIGAYPESTMFGILPAYGFYVRHASEVVFENVSITTDEPDARPDLTTDDATVTKWGSAYDNAWEDTLLSFSLEITSPAAGSQWAAGSEANITWLSTGDVNSVKLEYITGTDTNYIGWVRNTGSHVWSVPAGLTPGHYSIRVSHTFAAEESPSIAIGDPAGIANKTSPSAITCKTTAEGVAFTGLFGIRNLKIYSLPGTKLAVIPVQGDRAVWNRLDAAGKSSTHGIYIAKPAGREAVVFMLE